MLDRTREIDHYLGKLFPICRSITGNGNRKTLEILREIIPLETLEYPSNTPVYDWVIPKEWNIHDAWIKDAKGKKIVDFQKCNLHVVSYSVPVNRKLSFRELKEHLFYIEEKPNAIPYRTSYYKENWGFCISYNAFRENFSENEEYEVFIDTELKDGSLTVGELLIKGKSKKEFLISTYLCHPSLANDNLSGVILTAFLAKELLTRELNFSYRIIFIPETIGAIAYCAFNEQIMKQVLAGFVATTVGGPGQFGYKQSFDSKHYINSVAEATFKENNIDYITYPFDIHGSDERQYSSVGFRINTITICKDKYYEYDQYHTSKDNLDFVRAEYINESLNLYLSALEKTDKNLIYRNLYGNCEPMLSKHGLYPEIGGSYAPDNSGLTELDLILWLLFYCDGRTSLLQIADILRCDINVLFKTADNLAGKNILREVWNE